MATSTSHQKGSIPGNVVALAQDLIRRPSPSGREADVAQAMQRFFQATGFECIVDDANTVVAWHTFGPGPVVLMDGHIDTVAADPVGWTSPPFAAEVHDGRIYGRGASDMKGAVAGMMIAARDLVAQVAAGERSLTGTLVITGTTWEERFEGYTLERAFAFLETRDLRPDIVIIGEASELNVKRGQRGRTRVIVNVAGRAAHSAHPDAGLNAIHQATRLMENVRARTPGRNAVLGENVRELIGISSQPDPPDSVVPSGCRLVYDLRILPGETPKTVLAEFRSCIDACVAEDCTFAATVSLASEILVSSTGSEVTVTPFPPAWLLPEEHPAVQSAVAALQAISQTPLVTTYDFCTNGSYSAGVAGVPTLGYGPGKESTAHIVDEHLEIDELHAAVDGYRAIAAALLRQ